MRSSIVILNEGDADGGHDGDAIVMLVMMGRQQTGVTFEATV